MKPPKFLSRTKQDQHIRKHAKMRASERYGLKLNREDYDDLVLRIRNNVGVLARLRISCSRSALLVRYRGQDMVVVYSITHGNIVTFLPPDD